MRINKLLRGNIKLSAKQTKKGVIQGSKKRGKKHKKSKTHPWRGR